MEWIKELDELSPRIKNFLISISCLIPFWYLCVYLFNPFLFFHSNLYLIIPLTFCLSLLWYLVSLAFNGIVIEFINHKFDIKESGRGEIPILFGGLDSIIYLSVAIILGYWSKSKHEVLGFHYHFTSFLWLSFFFSLIRAILICVFMYAIHKYMPQQQSVEEQNTQLP